MSLFDVQSVVTVSRKVVKEYVPTGKSALTVEDEVDPEDWLVVELEESDSAEVLLLDLLLGQT